MTLPVIECDEDGLCSHCGAPLYPSERCDCWDRVPASVDRNPEGEKPQALSAEHERAVRASADAQPPTPEIEAEISRLNPLPAITRLNGGES